MAEPSPPLHCARTHFIREGTAGFVREDMIHEAAVEPERNTATPAPYPTPPTRKDGAPCLGVKRPQIDLKTPGSGSVVFIASSCWFLKRRTPAENGRHGLLLSALDAMPLVDITLSARTALALVGARKGAPAGATKLYRIRSGQSSH